MEVEVLVAATGETGGKSIFDLQNAQTAVRYNLAEVSQTLRSFCEGIQSSFKEFSDGAGEFSLSEIELSIELTAKGEVRLIAAASAETKGSIKA